MDQGTRDRMGGETDGDGWQRSCCLGWDKGGVRREEEGEGTWPVRGNEGGVEWGEREGGGEEEGAKHGEGGDVKNEGVVGRPACGERTE